MIVITASIPAYEGQIGQAAYAAPKGGVVALNLPAACELARIKIRVMTIAPGVFETPMETSMSADVQESMGKIFPFLSRLGRPADYSLRVKQISENRMLNGNPTRRRLAAHCPVIWRTGHSLLQPQGPCT